METKEVRPQARTIRRVVKHLNSLGLSVYGPYADLDTGLIMGGNMDYGPEEVLKYRKIEEGEGWVLASQDGDV